MNIKAAIKGEAGTKATYRRIRGLVLGSLCLALLSLPSPLAAAELNAAEGNGTELAGAGSIVTVDDSARSTAGGGVAADTAAKDEAGAADKAGAGAGASGEAAAAGGEVQDGTTAAVNGLRAESIGAPNQTGGQNMQKGAESPATGSQVTGSQVTGSQVTGSQTTSIQTASSQTTGSQTTGSQLSGQPAIKLYLDDQEIFLTDPIQNKNGRTYYPLRSYLEALGAKVTWQQSNGTVSAARGRVEAIYALNSSVYSINGRANIMKDAALYIDQTINRVYVPIRYGAEAFGFQVEWAKTAEGETIHLRSTPVSKGDLTDNEITINGKMIWLGQTESQLTESLGRPNRIDESAYGLQWHVYNRDYKEFVMVGMKDQRVRAFFTNCQTFGLKNNLGYGSAKKDADAAQFNGDTMELWFDPHNKDSLYAVFCMTEFPSPAEQLAIFAKNPDRLLRTYEQECVDITNAFRVANGKKEVGYNNYAARVALAHAKDMAERNYLSHLNPEGLDPLKRMEAAGLNVRKVSENLAGGFADAIQVLKGWVDSASHRQGMLEDNQYLGVGAYYKKASKYGFYFVQEFITLD